MESATCVCCPSVKLVATMATCSIVLQYPLVVLWSVLTVQLVGTMFYTSEGLGFAIYLSKHWNKIIRDFCSSQAQNVLESLLKY